ncbi:MAG: hypothetical protein OXC30_02585 [Alphaproteobacteria bacterium]|nr:hypothetical protein [Alphaproteobacteria bacterium]
MTIKRLLLFFVSTSLLFGAAFNAGKLLLSACEEGLLLRSVLRQMPVTTLHSFPGEPSYTLKQEVKKSGDTLLMLGRTASWNARFTYPNSTMLDTCKHLPKNLPIECHECQDYLFPGSVLVPASESSSFSFEANAFEEDVLLRVVRFMPPDDSKESAVNFGFINYEHIPNCTVLARYSNGVASAISVPCGRGRIVSASLPLDGQVYMQQPTTLGAKILDFERSSHYALLQQLYAPLRSADPQPFHVKRKYCRQFYTPMRSVM